MFSHKFNIVVITESFLVIFESVAFQSPESHFAVDGFSEQIRSTEMIAMILKQANLGQRKQIIMRKITVVTSRLMISSVSVEIDMSHRIKNGSVIVSAIVIATVSVDNIYEISIGGVQYIISIIQRPSTSRIQTCEEHRSETGWKFFISYNLPVMRGNFPEVTDEPATPAK